MKLIFTFSFFYANLKLNKEMMYQSSQWKKTNSLQSSSWLISLLILSLEQIIFYKCQKEGKWKYYCSRCTYILDIIVPYFHLFCNLICIAYMSCWDKSSYFCAEIEDERIYQEDQLRIHKNL